MTVFEHCLYHFYHLISFVETLEYGLIGRFVHFFDHEVIVACIVLVGIITQHSDETISIEEVLVYSWCVCYNNEMLEMSFCHCDSSVVVVNNDTILSDLLFDNEKHVL